MMSVAPPPTQGDFECAMTNLNYEANNVESRAENQKKSVEGVRRHMAVARKYAAALEAKIVELQKPFGSFVGYKDIFCMKNERSYKIAEDYSWNSFLADAEKAKVIAAENDAALLANRAIFDRIVTMLKALGLEEEVISYKRGKPVSNPSLWYSSLMAHRPTCRYTTTALEMHITAMSARRLKAIEERDRLAAEQAEAQHAAQEREKREREARELENLRRQASSFKEFQNLAKSIGFDPAKCTPEEIQAEIAKRTAGDGRERLINIEDHEPSGQSVPA